MALFLLRFRGVGMFEAVLPEARHGGSAMPFGCPFEFRHPLLDLVADGRAVAAMRSIADEFG